MPREVAVKMYKRGELRATPIDASVVTDEQKTIDLYLRFRLIPKRIDAAGIVDPTFTPAIAAGVKQ